MEANNHFNYGSHSVSSNSGLKLSSGDSPYTNGSSMSFPQQGKNMNGEMNVNGVTTVIGSSVPGSHPPTAPYPHMSNHHHQGSMGYDYGLWPGQPQYSPAMGSPPGHGMHQKQPPPGVMQQQTQHHFQGHGQYQLNGGMGGSRQPPVAAPPNVTLPGAQYWNRGNPGQQQMGYNSHGVYGAYQSQVHPGIAPSQHHQQQSLQPSPHQQTQQHLHPHHHPHHHHQQHQQQPQHYGMVPNGMPFYQHQPQHPPLPAPQPQAPPQSQPQTQAPMMPPTSQNFTPPRGSPQHHSLGRGGTGSPLPVGVSSVPMMSPPTVPDGGSPQSQTSERSPHGSNVGMPAVMQGRISEFKEVDKGFNGMERSSVAQRLPNCDSYPPKPPGPPIGSTSDYCQPVTQRHEVAPSAREAMTAPSHLMSSPPLAVSASPPMLCTSSLAKSTSPRVSTSPAVSGPPQASSGPPMVSSPATVSTPPRNSTPPVVSCAPSPSVPHRLSSPPLVVQGLRPPPATVSQMSPTVFTHPSVPSSPSSVCSSPPMSSAPPILVEKACRPPSMSTPHSYTAPSSVTPSMYSPPSGVSSFTSLSSPPRSISAPISALQQMVQGSRPPPLTPCPPAVSGAPREKSGPPPSFCGPLSSVTATKSGPPSTGSAPPFSVSALSLSVPVTPAVSRPTSAVRAPFESVPTPPQAMSPPLVSSPNSAVSPSPKGESFPFSTTYGPSAIPVCGPPPLTSPARASPVSGPPALMPALPPAVTAPPSAQTSFASAPPATMSTPHQGPKPMPLLEPEQHGVRKKIDPSIGPIGKPEERLSEDDKNVKVMMASKMDASEVQTVQSETQSIKSSPVTPHQSESSSKSTRCADRKFRSTDKDLEKSCLDDTCETEKSMDEFTSLHSTRMDDASFTERESTFNDSSLDDISRFDDTSRLISSSGMNDTSRLDDDCLQFDNSSKLDDSSRLDDSTSRLDDTSCMDNVSYKDDTSCTENRSQICDTAKYSSSSMDDSRDEVLDNTQSEDTSQAEETMGSFLSTRESILESSVNNTSQIEESYIDSSQNETSLSSSLSPLKCASECKDEEPDGRDIPDSAGTISGNGVADVGTVAPSVIMVKDEAVVPPVGSPVIPLLLPTPAEAVPPTGRKRKNPGKPRKPRAPTSSTPVSKVPEKAPRKPKAKLPKVEKVKKKLEKDGAGEKAKGGGRKRKKTIKTDITGPTGTAGEAVHGSFPGQEPIKTVGEASGESPPVAKPKKVKKAKKLEPKPAKIPKMEVDTKTNEEDNVGDDSSTAGDTPRRRIATEEQVHFPLLHGWRREVRVKKAEDRLKGETWYYTPCGRRMKQFPEVIKYLSRRQDSLVTREHFSFSPRMPVGDFYEERDSPEGVQWVLLANEEVPSMIMAITGRRGRPPNPDKEKPRSRVRRANAGQVRRPGRPSKPKMVDLLSKVDARMLKKLEAKDSLTDEDKEKLVKIKKKLKRKARMKRNEDAKNKKIKQEKKKAKLEKETKEQEVKAEPVDQETPQAPPMASQPPQEPKKPGRKKRVKAEVPPPVQETDQERIAQGKRVLGARSKAKALAKAQAEAEAAALAAQAAKRAAERRAQAQRRLEERKRQQMILEELKKPIEDMCLTDHKHLPELSRIPGLVLSGPAFSHCLTVVEFLHSYGKVLGLNIPSDVPSLSTLQEGLLGLGDSQGEVQDLLLKLVEAALHDPGLPSYYQSVKILGEKLVDLELTRSTVSEGARVFLESHGFDMEVCNTLRTKTFHALSPDTKAAILGFLVEQLNGSNIVISEIDNTLENMATYRKNKWIIEGKLRKLKAALAQRTGRPEEELCLEERRRSARVAEDETLGLDESSPVERGCRRARKEEAKLSDSDSPTNSSIPELERQIDKLTKRQVFFRKKLLQSSHSLRAVSLGQDRFRRRYWALPHIGGVLVEGPQEILASEDILVADVPITLVKREPKKEPKVEEKPIPTTPTSPPALSSSPPPAQSKTSSPEEDPLPGTASLMSSPRGRGRPRKIKPEVELHLRTAKNRRRRRSSKSGSEEGTGLITETNGTHDLTQTAFQSWLSQSQGAVTNGTGPATGELVDGSQAEDSVKEMAQKQGQWFNLLPKEPCDPNSLTQPQTPTSTCSPPKAPPQLPSNLPALAAPLLQSGLHLTGLDPEAPTTPQVEPNPSPTPAPTATATPTPAPNPTATPTPPRPGRRRRRGSSPARRGGARGGRAGAAKRRGRPPSTLFQEIEQQYFTQLVVKPIPASMVRGWWWIQDPEELTLTLQALHPRGIREKVLHKHLAKHMDYLTEMCTRTVNDPIFQVKVEEGDALLEALQQPWQVQERALETDISALRWVEDLEQRVITADLHLKVAPQGGTEGTTETPVAGFQPYTAPEADSTRDDLYYYEHDADPRDDWIVRTKKEWSDLPRIATHPLDLAVLRLANLERNIDRRYLKEPLWNLAEVVRLAPLTPSPGEETQMDVMSLESEITPRLRTWRQALDRCRSAPQMCLCLLQLEKAIAWERSVVKVTCQVCRKGDNDEYLLLCDGCDRGCHMYCLRPKVTQVPEGDWFCPTCIAKGDDESQLAQRSKHRTRVKKRRYEDDSSEEEAMPRRAAGMTTRHKDGGPASSSSSRYSGDGGAGYSPAKRRRMTTRNQPDLTYCEIILMEMEAHADAWPFLEPVNPRLVPGYRRIIKTPMDFLTMRKRLLQGGYCSCEEFSADAYLVFNNCELFNEDTSEVGVAGHSMRSFFENRWAEFYESKDK